MTVVDPLPQRVQEDINRDLGFGAVVSRESRRRLLNRDGSFNVRRDGMKPFASLSLYHHLLTISWPKFLLTVIVGFMVLNTVFGLAYVACGPEALNGAPADESGGSEFLRAFFFSVQTFATIGFGHISPASLAANLLVTLESLVGLLVFALATGLLFARFSRPTAKIVFSERALIAPYQDGTAFEFLRAFFFSVQTFATIGFGHISPASLAANLLVTVESLVGLLLFALATGLLFARFSRPTARIVFSERALIAPYQDGTAFEFRIVNSRSNQLIEVECQVLFVRFAGDIGTRKFVPLALERRKVTFFPLAWTVVHPIDAASPLHGLTHEDLVAGNAEFLVLLTGFDETFSQTVHTRSSYTPEEVVWGASFTNMYNPPRDGVLSVDIGRLNDYEPRALPAAAS